MRRVRLSHYKGDAALLRARPRTALRTGVELRTSGERMVTRDPRRLLQMHGRPGHMELRGMDNDEGRGRGLVSQVGELRCQTSFATAPKTTQTR